MAEAGRMSAAPGPPPVAVHDDPDVPRYRRVQALQGYAGLPTPARLAARACETSPHGGEVNGSLDLHHFGFFATGEGVHPLDLAFGHLLQPGGGPLGIVLGD